MAAFNLTSSDRFAIPIVSAVVGDFEIEVRRPTVQEQIKNLMEKDYESRAVGRLAQVVGWSNVVDADGEPIPFSQENLVRVCTVYPDVATEVFSELGGLFLTGGGRRKNFDGRLDSPPSEEKATIRS